MFMWVRPATWAADLIQYDPDAYRFAQHGATVIRETTEVFDFIVVGAGMAGASLAAALASTARVALIEAEQHPGFHATGRSAALFAPNYGSPIFRALTRASAAFLGSPPQSFSPRPLLRQRGAL